MTLTFFVLPLKDINYDLSIINLSQIVIMRVPCCYKVLIFISVAILLLIDRTNFAKADKDYNYGRYQYPDYQSGTYSFFITPVQINFTTIPEKRISIV